jgi:transforming growth factor-beta-induced protein
VHVFTRAGDTRVLIEDREPNARWANVIKADVDASNGVVHIIDRVLIPGRLTPTPPNPSGNQTIVQLAVATPTLSTLVAAVKAAGLVDTLSGPGPFTVFAPTNDAFDRLPAGALKYLLDPANKAELVKVLTFHVVAGNVQSNEVREGEVITTVEGGHLLAHVRDYQGERHIFLQDDVASRHFAEVIKADVEASNGVVHVIDSVLIPPRQLEQMKLN